MEKSMLNNLHDLGFTHIRELPNGQIIGLMRFSFTIGLCYGLSDGGDMYRGRYCYENWSDATSAVKAWDGESSPPGPWIKHKSLYEGEFSNYKPDDLVMYNGRAYRVKGKVGMYDLEIYHGNEPSIVVKARNVGQNFPEPKMSN